MQPLTLPFVGKMNFTDTPLVQYLKEDHQSELHCHVDGDPVPNISWTVRGKKVIYGEVTTTV